MEGKCDSVNDIDQSNWHKDLRVPYMNCMLFSPHPRIDHYHDAGGGRMWTWSNPPEEKVEKEVPLTHGIGGPVIGRGVWTQTDDGIHVDIIDLTDEGKKLFHDPGNRYSIDG